MDDAAGAKWQSFPRAALCLLEAFDAGHRKELRGVRGGVSVAERLSYVVVSLRETSEPERSFLPCSVSHLTVVAGGGSG